MKVAVTGASGFIAKHVITTLHQAGHEVRGIDVTMPEGVSFVTEEAVYQYGDITKPLSKVDGLDAVIHLAALSHPRQCDENPAKAYDVNVNGTSNVLRMALESGAKKFVFSSSAHVYDIPPRFLPTDETHALRLNNTYTTTKILGEQLAELYWTNHGLSYTTLRLFNAYGPGQALGYFIPDMISKAKTGKIDLTGGNTTKDWVWVEDVARAFVLALETPYVGALNIGTGIETKLVTIVDQIARITGASWLNTDSPRVSRMCADNSRAKRVLGWEPTKSIMEGIDAILDVAKV